MYTRQAYNKEEAWLLDVLDEYNMDETAFRSREFTLVFGEQSDDRPVGLGRVRENEIEEDGFSKEPFEETMEDLESENEKWCEFSNILVLPEGEKFNTLDGLLEGMVEYAEELGYDGVYLFTKSVEKFTPYNFSRVDYEELPKYVEDRLEKYEEEVEHSPTTLTLTVDDFETPDTEGLSQDEIEEEAKQQGLDKDHTHKYST